MCTRNMWNGKLPTTVTMQCRRDDERLDLASMMVYDVEKLVRYDMILALLAGLPMTF
jgi:hypothetical protein